jgi:hypothetical protein
MPFHDKSAMVSLRPFRHRNLPPAGHGFGELACAETPDQQFLVGQVILVRTDTSIQVDPGRGGAGTPDSDQIDGKSQFERKLICQSRSLRVHIPAGMEHEDVTVAEEDDRAAAVRLGEVKAPGISRSDKAKWESLFLRLFAQSGIPQIARKF